MSFDVQALSSHSMLDGGSFWVQNSVTHNPRTPFFFFSRLPSLPWANTVSGRAVAFFFFFFWPGPPSPHYPVECTRKTKKFICILLKEKNTEDGGGGEFWARFWRRSSLARKLMQLNYDGWLFKRFFSPSFFLYSNKEEAREKLQFCQLWKTLFDSFSWTCAFFIRNIRRSGESRCT